jgi:hypothetical protein
VSAGRNDPCPCGSGAKYKRCCLDRELQIERLVPELEVAVEDLAADTWSRDHAWCRAQFAELYDGGLEAFGLLGPSDVELLEAHLWFLLDCPLPSGETPLWRARRESTGQAIEMLARSELRAWRVESAPGPRLLSAVSPLDASHARLELARDPAGDVEPGSVVVARSVPVGPERWALLGAVPVVAPEVVGEFEQLLTSLDAPRGEIWRVHGGVIARAALGWPEEREHTLEGELVADMFLVFELRDGTAARRTLDADPEFDRRLEDGSSDAMGWRWRWDPPAARPPAAEPGVRFKLCREDEAELPWLADINIWEGDGELSLTAATRRRLGIAARLLHDRLGESLGPLTGVRAEPPEIMPRWKRLRLRDTFDRLSPQLRRVHRAA